MSTHKAAGGKASQHISPAGKRLGVKVGHNQKAVPGTVIIRQSGLTVGLGKGVKRGRDFTIYSVTEGLVQFGQKMGKKIVSVVAK